MTKPAYFTLDDGKTAVFTKDTKIIIAFSESDSDHPRVIEYDDKDPWYRSDTDLKINGFSFLFDFPVADFHTLYGDDDNDDDPDLKNHDYVVRAVYYDEMSFSLSLREIEHKVATR